MRARPTRRSRARRKAAFLDRDGVLNFSYERDGKLYAPRRLQDFRLLPGVRRAVRQLRRAGYLIVVVTNQPDIGNGLVPASVVEAMNRRLAGWIAPDAVEMCPHAQSAGCACRKPRPGMLLSSAERLGIDLRCSVMIGDRDSDAVAGKAAHCYTLWIRRSFSQGARSSASDVAFCLPAAVRLLAKRARRLRGRRGRI
jgi:D-glycero-D-manno-heptose 1,7-bisphosphate phosphatase